jgi:hypothetical protein
LRIELLTPTKRFNPRGGFEISSKMVHLHTRGQILKEAAFPELQSMYKK